MRQTTSLKLAAVLLLLTFICGCKMGPSDKELICTTMNNWKSAILAKDIDSIMTNYSDDFSSPESGSKEQVQSFMQRAIEDGWLDDIDINTDIAQVKITDHTAEFAPVEVLGDFEPMELGFTLKKEDKKTWRIINSGQK
jgi:hypothetical protein